MDKLAREYASVILDVVQESVDNLKTAKVIEIDHDATIMSITVEVGVVDKRRLRIAILPAQ